MSIGDAISVTEYTKRDLDALAQRTQAAVAELPRLAEQGQQPAIGSKVPAHS